ncbi:hypothetical protein BH09BAC3_BH09BAC3_16330 [soil metagenome]
MKNKITVLILLSVLLFMQACIDDLAKVTPKNVPTFDALAGEIGLTSLAKGGVYLNGFGGRYGSIDDGLGTGFHILVLGMHESMGDNIYVPWGNNNFKFLDNPTDIKLDNGTVVPMPIGTTQPAEIKLRNDRAYGASNPMLVEWTYMYVMNNACNVLLENVDKTTFTGDAATRKATIKAWARFWKGYAYSRIGSMYISGLIVDKTYATNGNYVTNVALLAEAKNQLEQAKTLLAGITSTADYNSTLGAIIPSYCLQNGIPTPAAFIRNINTLQARNILANKKVSATTPGPLAAMTAADWNEVKTLTSATSGIRSSDGVFVIKTTANPSTSIIDPFFGAVGPYAATNDPTYFISEKLTQDFRNGDKRFDQNFSVLPSPQINRRGRGLNFGTRWYLEDEGNGIAGVYTYSHTGTFGVDSHFMGASYEENELMQAEARINTADIAGGTAIIDAVRASQGAGLPAMGVVTQAAALEEIRSERRVALLFRGLAFYDSRRLGIINSKAIGGGRGPGGALNVPGFDHGSNTVVPGAIVLFDDGSVQKNAFINYNYLNFFDVPKNELEFNSPLSGSSVVISPN